MSRGSGANAPLAPVEATSGSSDDDTASMARGYLASAAAAGLRAYAHEHGNVLSVDDAWATVRGWLADMERRA